MIIAWNNVVLEQRPRYVRFGDDSPIPRITICADAGPNRSTVPTALTGEIDDDA